MSSVDDRYEIGSTEKFPEYIPQFLNENADDPAIKARANVSNFYSLLILSSQDFLPRLRTHLLSHVLDCLQLDINVQSSLPTNTEHASTTHVLIYHDQLYTHKIIKFNFTTYDMRRDQDVVNPGTLHCNVMVLAQPNSHQLPDEPPFLYGHILGVFHVNVIYNGPGAVDYDSQRFDCL